MNEFRVTKYDPQYRVGGAYTREEWTSFADVGRVFGGEKLTLAAYEQAEAQHIRFLADLAAMCGAGPLRINAYEAYDPGLPWREGQEIPPADLPRVVRDVLRERCWCRLVGCGFFIHFGYEYYLYVGCGAEEPSVAALAAGCGLFCEAFRSPYHDEEAPR